MSRIPKGEKPMLGVIVQRLFEKDPLFGVNLKLVERLSQHCRKLHVFPLYGEQIEGLENVEVHPFGHNSSESRLVKVWRLQRHVLSVCRSEPLDGLFIHQNHLYAPLLFWVRTLLGVRVVLFKAHGQLPGSVRFALPFIDTVLTSSEQGFSLSTPKKKIVGQSIDTEQFCPTPFPDLDPFRIVSVGRISPIKGYEVTLRALSALREDEHGFVFHIIGAPERDSDHAYLERLRELSVELGMEECVHFEGAKPYSEIPAHLSRAHLFVNSSVEESALDKVVLEAMAAGRPVLTTNAAYQNLLRAVNPYCLAPANDPEGLAERIQYWIDQPPGKLEETGKQLRQIVIENHSLDHFTRAILREFVGEKDKKHEPFSTSP